MNTFDLLKLSEAGSVFCSKLEYNIISCGLHYEFVDRMNKVLSKLDFSQSELLKEKFLNFSNTHQLHDKMSEILVAYRYLDQNPVFGDDQKGDVDIFLRDSNRYVEVKSLNMSDFQKKILDGNGYNSSSPLDITEEKRKRDAVFQKAKELIDKAIKQLECKEGIIVLVYTLDSIKNFNLGKEDLCTEVKNSFKSLGSLTLELVSMDDLHGKRHY